jgi:hypothetical protein
MQQQNRVLRVTQFLDLLFGLPLPVSMIRPSVIHIGFSDRQKKQYVHAIPVKQAIEAR